MGHIVTSPTTDIANPIRADQLVKLNNGRWAVLLGNGVNSINERPVLLIQYLDGSREIGYLVAQPTKNAGNGLGAPRPIDVDGNGTTDVVYAGDLQGQLWKFDMTSTDPLKWGVAAWNSANVCNGAISICQPLMTARSSNNKAQPILVAPAWLIHPLGGLVLNFGTGQLLEEKDRKDTTTHPQLLDGLLMRFETQVPPTSPEEGLCSASIRSELGYVTVLNGITGNPPQNAVFYSPDSTLDLANASRVQFGNGESLQVESGRQLYLISTDVGKGSGGGTGGTGSGGGSGGGSNSPYPLNPRQIELWLLKLERQAATPRTVDWRILP